MDLELCTCDCGGTKLLGDTALPLAILVLISSCIGLLEKKLEDFLYSQSHKLVLNKKQIGTFLKEGLWA